MNEQRNLAKQKGTPIQKGRMAGRSDQGLCPRMETDRQDEENELKNWWACEDIDQEWIDNN